MNTGMPSSRREFLQHAAAGLTFALSGPMLLGSDRALVRTPACSRSSTAYEFRGPIQGYLRAVTEHWLKVAPASNPAMLEIFRDKDRKPLRNLEPWAGEFAGKYLTSAVQVLRCYPDPELQKHTALFVQRLLSLQDRDGYLGPWPKGHHLTGNAPNAGKSGGPTWDAWGHYHIMLGLLLWHEQTASAEALVAASKIADLFYRTFQDKRLVDTGSTEMNLAPVHAFALLYQKTWAERYLKMAEDLVGEFAVKDSKGAHLAGDYLNSALAGKEFFQMPKPRWESLHPIMALPELYYATGKDQYRKAFENIWWSIVKLDRHNNGGFSSGEQAQGNPYHQGAIETCCTIAWSAMSVEMLRLTGNSIVADELELSALNSVIGMHSPAGRWITYNTPMDGVRKASAHDIVFQAREGSPELNCCSVNGARGFGMLSDWALMTDREGILINWYGPGAMKLTEKTGIQVRQNTEYPRTNTVTLDILTPDPLEYTVKLRIPHWSRLTRVTLNGKAMSGVQSGTYLPIRRKWERKEQIQITFDFSPHFWVGEKECAGKTSIFRGPLLLTYDRRFNTMDPADVPVLQPRAELRPVEWQDWFPPIVLLETTAADGQKVRLCDFGSAGVGGSPYRSWLPVENVRPTDFSTNNPLRTGRA